MNLQCVGTRLAREQLEHTLRVRALVLGRARIVREAPCGLPQLRDALRVEWLIAVARRAHERHAECQGARDAAEARVRDHYVGPVQDEGVRHDVGDRHVRGLRQPVDIDLPGRGDEGPHRQVAERGIGRASGRERERLAGQPLERAVLAEVHDRVRGEASLPNSTGEPAVRREVVVRRRQVGVVVDRDRVLAEPARRLDEQYDVARRDRGQPSSDDV